MVSRPVVIEYVRRFYRSPLIKVISGIRRSGKTSVLKLVREDFVDSGEEPSKIFFLSMESLDNAGTASQILDRIRSELVLAPGEKGILLIDEVQEIRDWEKLLASLLAEESWDIYVTGSNSRLLGSELSTHLSGRYVEIPVFTLGYREYLTFVDILGSRSSQDPFVDFMTWGGFPGLLHLKQDALVLQSTLGSYMDSLVLRDVIQRHRIRDADSLLRILRFGADNVGSLVSSRNISAYFWSQGLKISVDTVQAYLGFLTQAYIFFPVRRYDLKGKRHLEHLEKYYLADPGIKTALLGPRPQDIAGTLENIVFLELKRRGWQVSIGVTDNFEIDFVAERGGEFHYYQVCYVVADKATQDREFGNLAKIPDNWPKTVLSLDPVPLGTLEGIEHRNIKEWLLE